MLLSTYPIHHEIPRHLRKCIRRHTTDPFEPKAKTGQGNCEVVIANKKDVIQAVEKMRIGIDWIAGDLREHMKRTMKDGSITGHLSPLVVDGVLESRKVGNRRYYRRVM